LAPPGSGSAPPGSGSAPPGSGAAPSGSAWAPPPGSGWAPPEGRPEDPRAVATGPAGAVPLPAPGTTGTSDRTAFGPRPDGIPLRPLDPGDILDGTFGTIPPNRRAMLGPSSLLAALQPLPVVGAEV